MRTPLVREVLTRCEELRVQTQGDFNHQLRRASGDPSDPLLDVNALAKGWIVEQAATVIRSSGASEYFVNAGGDLVVQRQPTSRPWRVGVQHPTLRTATAAVFEVHRGAIATSGAYERCRPIIRTPHH